MTPTPEQIEEYAEKMANSFSLPYSDSQDFPGEPSEQQQVHNAYVVGFRAGLEIGNLKGMIEGMQDDQCRCRGCIEMYERILSNKLAEILKEGKE